jgi:3-hydroxybutyryl-CoA dehydrogenase
MKSDSIRTVGIAGAGLMGSGIAQVFAQVGYEVILFDLWPNALDSAHKAIERNHEVLLKFGLIDQEAARRSFEQIKFTTQKELLSKADFLLETIDEKLEAKQVFWKEMNDVLKPETLLATNTSGLSITAIARDIKRKEQFAGMHWWTPPYILPLVEVVLGEKSSMETAQRLIEIAEGLGKEVVLVKKDVPGFIGNRINYAVFREAVYMVEQGIASPEDIDKACKCGPGFRYPFLGPLQIADVGNLETWHNVASYLFRDLCRAQEPPQILRELVANGHLGVKTGKGFFDYSDGKGEKILQERDHKFLLMLKHIL